MKTGLFMKKPVLFLCLLLGGIGVAAQAPTGVIGINTMNPRGVLHIDGASTQATTNPAAGEVDATQASDDVIVDTQGRIGVGHLSPEAKIDLHSDAPGGGLRIQDGTEGEGRLLFSDENGTGSWAPLLQPAESWYASLYDGRQLEYSAGNSLRDLDHYNGSLIIPGAGGAVDAVAGTITLAKSGRYRVYISMHWECNRSGVSNFLAQVALRVNGSPHRTFNNWGINDTSAGVNSVHPSFFAVLPLNAGDVLSLATDETATNSANRAQAVLFMVELLR
jgi:hypothetical protein